MVIKLKNPKDNIYKSRNEKMFVSVRHEEYPLSVIMGWSGTRHMGNGFLIKK